MTLQIIDIGHPVLREIATPVTTEELASDEMQSFIDALIETKRAANGAGIAANQVARAQRVFVVEVSNNPRYPYKPEYPLTVLVNPEIEFLTDERFENFEGCLSIPNLRGAVMRCPEIHVRALDRKGSRIEFDVSGITAGTFQHELDHLEGILFPDRVENTHTLCTWDEFKKHFEPEFRENVARIVAKYGS